MSIECWPLSSSWGILGGDLAGVATRIRDADGRVWEYVISISGLRRVASVPDRGESFAEQEERAANDTRADVWSALEKALASEIARRAEAQARAARAADALDAPPAAIGWPEILEHDQDLADAWAKYQKYGKWDPNTRQGVGPIAFDQLRAAGAPIEEE